LSAQVRSLVVDVVVPARDAASELAPTLAAIPSRMVRSVVVVDNGSTDSTAQVALDAGAVVVREPRVGYGAACRRAVDHLAALPEPPEVVVFLAPDGVDDPRDLPRLLGPIRKDNAELVIGVRPEAPAGQLGARVAVGLIGAIYGHRFENVDPYRAIRFPALVALGLRDRGSGWNVEMQVKAVRLGLHIDEVAVAPGHSPHHRRRMIDSVGKTGRMLFHILRHATVR
jgi:glycosyltransferase involved in cell wall biosynthesis